MTAVEIEIFLMPMSRTAKNDFGAFLTLQNTSGKTTASQVRFSFFLFFSVFFLLTYVGSKNRDIHSG